MGAFNPILMILILLCAFLLGNCQFHDNSNEAVTWSNTCARLSKDLERALLADEGNLFRMRKAFFYSPTASPVLLKVVYNISYGENVISDKKLPCCSNTSFTWDKSTREHQSCKNVSLVPEGSGKNITFDTPDYFNSSTVKNTSICIPKEAINCSNSIELQQRSYVYGWTSTGVYVVFHPIVLTMMQAQIPLAALRIVHKTLIGHRSPEADTFLWDGSYDLPILYLNLHVTSLSCIPTEELFTSVLKDLNTLVRSQYVYLMTYHFFPVGEKGRGM